MRLIPDSPVIVVPYNPLWPRRFERLRSRVAEALGELAVAIEHIGSTAVVGLAAKPIIDIDAVIPDRAELQAAIDRLALAGYEHRGDLGIRGREAFGQPPELPDHHLYVCAQDSDELARHLRFRDHLRTHPVDALAYAQLKRVLAMRFHTDRIGYVDGKRAFVETILARAGSADE